MEPLDHHPPTAGDHRSGSHRPEIPRGPGGGPGHADRLRDARPAGPARPVDGGRPADADHPGEEDPRVGLAAALRAARSARCPGPDTPAGPAVPDWAGPRLPIPHAGPAQLDLRALLRLSLAASDGSGRLRPAPSAGALHPVDTALVVGSGCSLPPGRYGYDPLRHRVHRLGRQPAATPPGVTVELSVTARRTASHYGHRAWPLLLLDTGHAVGALLLAARALGCEEPELRLEGEARSPLAAVRIRPTGPAQRLQAPRSAPPSAGTPTPGELLARRSTPPPLPGTPPPYALRAVLRRASRAGGGDLRWAAAVGPPRPGLTELTPDGTALRRCAAGETRPTLAAWAAGQAWIADAGAVLLARGCPGDAGAAHIRRTHLRAGLAVHLAHVTALRHGLTARPVGSWQQADLGAAVGGAPDRDWIVHGLALGTLHAAEENTA